MGKYFSTKVIELGSTAFRQPRADSHCKYIHGYQLKAKIWFACNELDGNNWVFDFGALKELKEKLQGHYDHKCVITKDDPAKHAFKELERYGAVSLIVMDGVGIEKFAEHVFIEADTFVKYKTTNRVWVKKVEVFEHQDNSAIFTGEIPAAAAAVTGPVASVPVQQSTATSVSVNLSDFISPKSQKSEPKPAPIGSTSTSGWSNPFAGTSWGA